MFYHNTVARSRNIYTSSVTLTVRYHLSRRERFYGELGTPAAMKLTSLRKASNKFAPSLIKRRFLKRFLPQ